MKCKCGAANVKGASLRGKQYVTVGHSPTCRFTPRRALKRGRRKKA